MRVHDNRAGNIEVKIYATKNLVASFQTHNLLEAGKEIARESASRLARGLPMRFDVARVYFVYDNRVYSERISFRHTYEQALLKQLLKGLFGNGDGMMLG